MGYSYNVAAAQQSHVWPNHVQYQKAQLFPNSVQSASNGPKVKREKLIPQNNQTGKSHESPGKKQKLTIPPSPPRRKPKRTRWSVRLKPLVLNPEETTDAQNDQNQPNKARNPFRSRSLASGESMASSRGQKNSPQSHNNSEENIEGKKNE